jgi:hypothetical protein
MTGLTWPEATLGAVCSLCLLGLTIVLIVVGGRRSRP